MSILLVAKPRGSQWFGVGHRVLQERVGRRMNIKEMGQVNYED